MFVNVSIAGSWQLRWRLRLLLSWRAHRRRKEFTFTRYALQYCVVRERWREWWKRLLRCNSHEVGHSGSDGSCCGRWCHLDHRLFVTHVRVWARVIAPAITSVRVTAVRAEVLDAMPFVAMMVYLNMPDMDLATLCRACAIGAGVEVAVLVFAGISAVRCADDVTYAAGFCVRALILATNMCTARHVSTRRYVPTAAVLATWACETVLLNLVVVCPAGCEYVVCLFGAFECKVVLLICRRHSTEEACQREGGEAWQACHMLPVSYSTVAIVRRVVVVLASVVPRTQGLV